MKSTNQNNRVLVNDIVKDNINLGIESLEDIKEWNIDIYNSISKSYVKESSFSYLLKNAKARANEHNSGLDNKDNNKNKQNER